MIRLLLMIVGLSFLAACGLPEGESYKPQSAKDQRKTEHGSLIGGDDESGFNLLGLGSESQNGGSSIAVNSFLWRATLDTLSFMPLSSADPFGGVVITDWYEDPKTPGERYKVNALILDRNLRADGVRVTLFKQKHKSSGWRDIAVDAKLARSLEDTILTRARQLKVSGLGK